MRENKDKEINQYVCGYCQNVFQQSIRSSFANSKHKLASSQVQCPKCSNFLKTFGD